MKPSRTFRQSEIVAYEYPLPSQGGPFTKDLSPSLKQDLSHTPGRSAHTPGRSRMKYARVLSSGQSGGGDEGFGVRKVLLKISSTSSEALLSTCIYSFKVLYEHTCYTIFCCVLTLAYTN